MRTIIYLFFDRRKSTVNDCDRGRITILTDLLGAVLVSGRHGDDVLRFLLFPALPYDRIQKGSVEVWQWPPSTAKAEHVRCNFLQFLQCAVYVTLCGEE